MRFECLRTIVVYDYYCSWILSPILWKETYTINLINTGVYAHSNRLVRQPTLKSMQTPHVQMNKVYNSGWGYRVWVTGSLPYALPRNPDHVAKIPILVALVLTLLTANAASEPHAQNRCTPNQRPQTTTREQKLLDANARHLLDPNPKGPKDPIIRYLGLG